MKSLEGGMKTLEGGMKTLEGGMKTLVPPDLAIGVYITLQ